MRFSFVAIDRMAAERAAKDDEYRQALEASPKLTLARGRAITDDQLLEKLRALGLPIDREWLEKESRDVLSAQQLALAILESGDYQIPKQDEDWVWVALVCLWERWFPDRPNFEMIDDQMQAGFHQLEQDRLNETLRLWTDCWRKIVRLMREFDFSTIKDFDESFAGTQSVFNWAQIYRNHLSQALRTDISWVRKYAALCGTVLAIAPGDSRDRLLIPEFRRGRIECEAILTPAPEESVSSVPVPDWEIDDIVAELEFSDWRRFPEDAIRAALLRPQEITPHLIGFLRRATAAVRADRNMPGNGFFIAFYLLAQFQAKEALPAIIEAVSLPGDVPYDLFGDAITEDLRRVLAILADDHLDLIDRLIDDTSIDEFVRSAAADAYRLLVRDGRLTRGEAVERLRIHLEKAIERDDSKGANWQVFALYSLASCEAQIEIELAFNRGLVDETLIDQKEFEHSFAGGDAFLQSEFDRLPPTKIDALDDLGGWWDGAPDQDFGDEDDEWDDDEVEDWDEDEEYDETDDDDESPGFAELFPPPSTNTIRNVVPRVGRNQPCPCGSGKKYKKCCGKNHAD